MKADDGLRKIIQDKLPRPTWLWTPIETGGTISGVPDSHFVYAESIASGWVESKATDGWAVEVRPHQVSWAVPRVAAGERVTIAVRAKGKGSSNGHGDSLWLIRGSAIAQLQEHGLKLPGSAVLGIWYGAPRHWDWTAIAEIFLARDLV